jgi:hypothetical protein
MKKIFLAFLLVFILFPAFTQDTTEDEYAKFQGVWSGITTDNETYSFMFIDNTVVWSVTDSSGYSFIVYGKFRASDKVLTISHVYGFTSDTQTWESIEDQDSGMAANFQYLFSKNSIILVDEDLPIILTKVK